MDHEEFIEWVGIVEDDYKIMKLMLDKTHDNLSDNTHVKEHWKFVRDLKYMIAEKLQESELLKSKS